MTILGGYGALGCSGDTSGPPQLESSQLFWALQLNYHAINMALAAPYNTVQLTAVPLNVAGDTLTGFGTVTYTAADSTVTVSPTGLVTAHYTTQSINSVTNVIAALTDSAHHFTLKDTVYIQVTPTAMSPSLATLTIQPADGDSAKRDLLTDQFILNVRAADAAGNSVSVGSGGNGALLAYFSSSNPTVATVDRAKAYVNYIQQGQVGLTTFHATTFAYGVVRSDSLRFIIGYRSLVTFGIDQTTAVNGVAAKFSFSGSDILARGGLAAWDFDYISPDSMDVTFDNPSSILPGGCFSSDCADFPDPDPNGGNILPWAPDSVASDTNFVVFVNSIERRRKFPVAGSYRFHSRLHPEATGELIVRDDPHY